MIEINTVYYCANIAACIAMPVLFLAFQVRVFRLPVINPLSILFCFNYPIGMLLTFSGAYYALDGGVFNFFFQYALIVHNVYNFLGMAVSALLITLSMSSRAIRDTYLHFRNLGNPVRPARMRFLSTIFFFAFLISFGLCAQHSVGIVQWVLDPRTSYQYGRSGAGHWYALSMTFLGVSYFLNCSYSSSAKRVYVLFPIYLFFAYLLGAKGNVFQIFWFTLIALTSFRVKNFLLIGVFGAAGCLYLLARSFHASGISFDLSGFAAYSDHFVNAAHYYEKHLSGEIPLLDGEVARTQLYSLVPRSIWPDKPYAYGPGLINEILWPGLAETTHTPAIATVEYYADFGWAGVVINGILNPTFLFTALTYPLLFCTKSNIRRLCTVRHGVVLTLGYMVVFSPSFMAFINFPLNILGILLLGMTCLLFNRLSIEWRTLRPALRKKEGAKCESV
jgi:hypothetical protein